MLSSLMNPGPEVLVGLMFLASLRIYLEIIGYDFLELPLTKALCKGAGRERLARFHRMGLIFSIGYIVLFSPELLMS